MTRIVKLLLIGLLLVGAQARGASGLGVGGLAILAQPASGGGGSGSFWTNNPAVTSGVDGYFCSSINSVAITNLTGASVTLQSVTMAVAGEGTSHLEVWTAKNAGGTQKGGASDSYIRTGGGWTTNHTYTWTSSKPTWSAGEVLYLSRVVDAGQAWVGMTVSGGAWTGTSFCGASETSEGTASWMIWEMIKE